MPSGTKFYHRRPSLWDDFQLWRKDATVNTATIVDAEIAAAKGKLDFWLYDMYPPASILAGSGDENDVSYIHSVFEAHAASAHKNDVKFALLLQHFWMVYPNGSGNHFQAQCDYIADMIADSAYQRINGQPLIALYNDGWTLDHWNQLKDTIGEAVFGVAVNSASMVSTLSLQANMRYEYNGTGISGAGRHSYAELAADDLLHDGSLPGAQRISNRTISLDRRTFSANTAFTDSPTQPQWVQAIGGAIQATQKFVIIATWDEIAEQGIGLTPSVQEESRYLDAIDWIRNGNYPSIYTFKWSANWLSCGSSGTWTEYFPDPNGVQGAHDGDQVHSTETGAYKTITLNLFTACDIYAETGPDCGIVEILKDDVLDQTIDCYAASQTVSAKIATVTFAGIPNTHTVKVRVKGEKNASSSSVKIKLDYFAPTYVP